MATASDINTLASDYDPGVTSDPGVASRMAGPSTVEAVRSASSWSDTVTFTTLTKVITEAVPSTASTPAADAMVHTTLEYDFPNNTFTPWDFVVFGGVLVISAGIGVFFACTGGKQKTTSEFLMADRSMSIFPVTLSLLASFMSAITLLGTPAEIYIYGTQYWMIWLGYVIMIPLAAHIFIPIFYDLQITSVFEYLQLRFGTAVRIFACVCFIVQMTLYMAIVLYTPCLALNIVTGFNTWISVCLVGIVCTFYTTLGGMKAVMWTDAFQIFMMFGGLIAVLVKGSIDYGGFGNIWQFMVEGERVEFFDFDPNPTKRHSVWALVFGGCFTWLAIFGVNQAQIQRAICCPRKRDGQIAMWLNLPGLTALLTVCSLCGMVVYAEYRSCDPLLTHRIKATDQLLPQYVMDRLYYPGLPGLFTACLFSGALSTISSGLNSLAAVTLEDLIKDRCYKNMSDKRATVISKILAFSYGLLMIALSYVASHLGGVLQAALGLFGMIGGPVLGLFILGMIYPWANHIGAFVGTLCGLLCTLWLGIGAQVFKPAVYKPPVSIAGCPLIEVNTTMSTYTTDLMYSSTTTAAMPQEDPTGYLVFYEVSYMWYSTFAVLVTNIIGLLVSACTGFNKASDVDARLIHPIIHRLCCCCPDKTRHRMKCGVGDTYTEDDVVITKDVLDKYSSKHEENGYVNPAADVSASRSSVSDIQFETHL